MEGDDGCSTPSVEPELSRLSMLDGSRISCVVVLLLHPISLLLDYECVPTLVFQKSVPSKASFLLSIQYTVRPIRAERMEIAFALPCFFSILATYFFAVETSRIMRSAASEKAHLR